MSQRVKIFVEGIADKTFLRQYVNNTFNIQLTCDDVITTGGWQDIKSNTIVNQLKKNTDDGGVNLVIFDADADLEARKAELEQIRQDKGIAFDLFLMPDNQNTGALEDLLEQIINPENQCVMDCWHRYEADLKEQTIAWKTPSTPTSPAKKSMIYGYLEALLGTSKSQKDMIKEKNRIYTDTNHWNLMSEALQPLKSFLSSYLTDQEDTKE